MASHPDDETLRLFAVGRLTETRCDKIEAHLADCEVCARRLEHIERESSDPFLRKMRAASLAVEPDQNVPEPFAPGILLGGHFRLEERLGRGGMGEAWKAFDETARRHVVLKFVPKDVLNFAEAMDAVRESFQKVHALQHANICPLYLLDNDPEHGFFLAMKYIDGLPLDVYRRQYGPLPFEEIVRILLDVADALDYAHRRKVIHRDIKPANIMIGETDGTQLIDFGVADEIRTTRTRSEDVSVSKTSGTRSYMAPEQWLGQKQDARTDQYALAVTAYELLAGHVPFSGTDTEVLKNAVLHDPPAPIPDLPEHANAALLRGLAKRREDRFESCRAFVEALATDTTNELSRLPSTIPKNTLWKWMVSGIVSAFIISVLVFSLFRQSSELPIRLDAGNHTEPVEVDDKKAGAMSELPERPDATLVVPTRNRRTVIPVVRVTVEVDEDAKGRFTVHRTLSSEPLRPFSGIPFNYRAFRSVAAFRGDNGMTRFLFGNGDITDTTNTQAVLADQKSAPFGWKYRRSGCSYDGTTESMRFDSSSVGETSGVLFGKQGELPCRITFEVIDNDEFLPCLSIIFYKDSGKGTTHGIIRFAGFKEDSGRLRIAASFAPSPESNEYSTMIEDVSIESNGTFFRDFHLPLVVGGDVDMIEYCLYTGRTKLPRQTTTFHLTLLDIVGKFQGQAGFRVFQGPKSPTVSSIGIGGPASDLATGAEIVSINGQSGTATELQRILDDLNFGDLIEVRTAIINGQGLSTHRFHAE